MYTVGLLMILHSVPLYITVTLKIINIKGTKKSGFFLLLYEMLYIHIHFTAMINKLFFNR